MIEFVELQSAVQQLAQAREGLDTSLLQRLMGFVGIATMLAIAWGISTNRKKVQWRIVSMGVGLQAVFGFIVLKTAVGQAIFSGA
ncbi:MAG: Na+ dependent nucleoside transporter N-terminal domain-containing protein, partial [Gemmatimonadales bacterium]